MLERSSVNMPFMPHHCCYWYRSVAWVSCPFELQGLSWYLFSAYPWPPWPQPQFSGRASKKQWQGCFYLTQCWRDAWRQFSPSPSTRLLPLHQKLNSLFLLLEEMSHVIFVILVFTSKILRQFDFYSFSLQRFLSLFSLQQDLLFWVYRYNSFYFEDLQYCQRNRMSPYN